MINYEYANHIDEQYIYVNREEDLGWKVCAKQNFLISRYFTREMYSRAQ